MGTTYRSAAYRWDGEDTDDSVAGDGQSRSAAAAEIFDDPTIVDELNEANASLIKGIVAPPTASMPVSLPPVDAFDFDEACRAKNLANKLGPPDRNSRPRRYGWLFPAIKSRRQDDEWSGPYSTAPRGLRRGFFWGFCASLVIVSVAPMILGIFRPLDGPLPRPIDSNGQGISSEVRTPAPAGPSAINSEQKAVESPEAIVVQSRPAAASVIGPTLNAFASPMVPPASLEDQGEQIDDPAVFQPETSTSATESPVTEFSVTESSQTPGGSPAEPEAVVEESSETVAALTETVAGDEEPTAVEQIQELSPVEIPPSAESVETDANAGASIASVAQPEAEPFEAEANASGPIESVALPEARALSSEEVDRLLARGEVLLRSGDITSARMLFSHVAAAGDPRGAKAVGMTYDPDVFAHLPVMGLTPDPVQAEHWYQKAGAIPYTIDLATDAALANASEPEDTASQQWNAACAQKYRSFDPNTGFYTALSGAKRRCQLP